MVWLIPQTLCNPLLAMHIVDKPPWYVFTNTWSCVLLVNNYDFLHFNKVLWFLWWEDCVKRVQNESKWLLAVSQALSLVNTPRLTHILYHSGKIIQVFFLVTKLSPTYVNKIDEDDIFIMTWNSVDLKIGFSWFGESNLFQVSSFYHSIDY